MLPDGLVELHVRLAEEVKNVQVVRQRKWNLARVILHTAEQVVGQDAHCVLIDSQAMADALIEDFWCTELKTLKVIEETLSFRCELDSLVHRFNLDAQIERHQVCFEDFDCLKTDVSVHYLSTVQVAHDLQKLAYDREHDKLELDQ